MQQPPNTSGQPSEIKPDHEAQIPIEPSIESSVTPSRTRAKTPDISSYTAQGVARVYPSGLHGSLTSSGEVYDIYGMTAAAALPLYSRVEVLNPQTGRKAIVTINDQLSDSNALIQISYEAATILGLQPENPFVVVRGLPAQHL
ncbi:MAG: RlpA-like double-psi beta-barrel domain-containing protein [Thiotrichaceae bacterium]